MVTGSPHRDVPLPGDGFGLVHVRWHCGSHESPDPACSHARLHAASCCQSFFNHHKCSRIRSQSRIHAGISKRLMATICSLPWGAASTLADTVEIRGGGQLSGSLKRLDVEKTPFVVVELDDKIRVAVPASQVGHVAAEEKLAEYRQQAAKVGEDADQHYELARWCKEKLLLAQNKHHLQRTISLDPNHAKGAA